MILNCRVKLSTVRQWHDEIKIQCSNFNFLDSVKRKEQEINSTLNKSYNGTYDGASDGPGRLF